MSTIEATEVKTVSTNINGAAFKRALSNAAVFSSTDRDRTGICAVRLELTPGEVKAVATDSYAAYTETVAIDYYDHAELAIDLNLDDAKRLIKLLDKALEVVLTFGETSLQVWVGGTEVTFNASWAAFPDLAFLSHGNTFGNVDMIGFRAKLLGKLAKIKTNVVASKNTIAGATGDDCVFHFQDQLKPAKVTIGSNISIWLMPVRLP